MLMSKHWSRVSHSLISGRRVCWVSTVEFKTVLTMDFSRSLKVVLVFWMRLAV